jgi:hypothetical protein
MVVGMALSAFWAAPSGLAYSTFILNPVAALHAGRKQPTMTAPAKAANSRRIDSDGAVSDFVDGDEPRRSPEPPPVWQRFLVVPYCL